MDNIEQILKAFRWKLGIPVDKDAAVQVTWNRLMSSGKGSGIQRCGTNIAESLGKLFEQAILYKLGLLTESDKTRDDVESLEALCVEFGRWLNEIGRAHV